MLNRVLLLVIGVAIAGCVSPQSNYKPDVMEISEPPLNATVTAYVGDNLLRQGKFVEHQAIFLPADVRVGLIASYTLRKGYYLKDGDNRNSGFYYPSNYQEGGAIVPCALCDPPKVVQALADGGKICVVTVFNVSVCESKQTFRFTKQAVSSADSFQQTLIYSGKVGNKINVSYREFSGNVARPAFSNDVEYDLSESRTIGYKGAQIEVLEATNELLRYKVLRNFNAAQF